MREADEGKNPAETHSVLVVDDDRDFLTNAKFMLRDYDVETFVSPLEALGRLAQKNFSVVLSDYQMPEMNGVEFLKRTLECSPKTKRVLISAFLDLVHGEELWNQAKVQRILAKPFTPPELKEVVDAAVLEFVIELENERLRKLALTDSLTGVANQRYFWDRLRSEFSRARRFSRPLTVVLFDMDSFKEINDSKGHLEGDRVLKEVASSLISETRQMDLVARYGGDEFALILPETDAEGAYQIANRLREKVWTLHQVSLSGGLSSCPPFTSERDLVSDADVRLLKAKRQAKGQVIQ